MAITIHKRILLIAKREVFRIASKPMYLFCMVIAPIFCYLFFTTLMGKGLPTNLPAGVVDLDNTATTRNIIRNLDAFQQTETLRIMQVSKKLVRLYSEEKSTRFTTSLKEPQRKHCPADNLRFLFTSTIRI